MPNYLITVKPILLCSLLYGQIDYNEFASRRATLMQTLEEGIVILKGADRINRNQDVEYLFRQNSNFYYLSGFDEEQAAMILLPGQNLFVMFVKPNDPKKVLWQGENYGLERTKQIFKADSVIAADSFEVSLKSFLKNKKKIFLAENEKPLNELVNKILKTDTLQYPGKTESLKPYLEAMRQQKSVYETELIQRAITITTEALHSVFKKLEPAQYEYELNALITYTYLKNNSPRHAFPSIVASGPNATILHYRNRDRKIKENDLVLFDIGAEYGMYAADISRTVPANGKFNREQKDIYQIVLDAQKAGIAACRPGIGIREVSDISNAVIKEGLLKLGLITDKESLWQMYVWFPHGLSHWLGLDTHDSGSYGPRDGKGTILQPGMVFTVEPGIYISALAFDSFSAMFGGMVSPEEAKAFREAVKPAFEKYKDIGVRIEDDILITENGHKNMSEKVVKEITDIEKLMAE